MADISKITPPGSQTTYNLKDATAREQAAENKNNILFSVQSGVKNFCPTKSSENTTGNKWVIGKKVDNTESINLPIGSYIFTATSTSTGSGQCQIKLKFDDGTTQNLPSFDFGASMTLTFMTSKKVVGYGIYANPAPVVFDNMMIRPSFTDSIYDDYAMTNAELTAAIQALQAQLANQ